MLPQNLNDQIIPEDAAGQQQMSHAEGRPFGHNEQLQDLSEVKEMLDKYKDHTYRMLLMEAMAAKSFSKKKAEKLKTTFLGDTLEQKQLDDEPECESSEDEAVEEEERGEGGQEQENQENVENDLQTDSS